MSQINFQDRRERRLYRVIKHKQVHSSQEVYYEFIAISAVQLSACSKSDRKHKRFLTQHFVAAVLGVKEAATGATAADTTESAESEKSSDSLIIAAVTMEATSTATSAPTNSTEAILASNTVISSISDEIKRHRSPPAVMSGSCSVLSAEQLKDVAFAVNKVKNCPGTWPFANSWYYPPSGPKLSHLNSRDPTKYMSIPVLLFMPMHEFSSRIDKCPCAAYGYAHKRVVSNGYTEACRVVGSNYTYAMVGNRYICHDCKDLGSSLVDTYTFSSYDERVLAYLPPDIR
jgi:hypothetical protein